MAGDRTGLGRAGVVAAVLAAAGAPAAAQSPQGDGVLRRPGSGAEAEAAVGSFFAAEVAANGTLVSGAGAVSAAKVACDTAAGCYEVIFRRNNLHRACWWSAAPAARSIGGVAPPAVVHVEPRIGTNNGLFIFIRNPAGTPVDADFIVTAICR